MVAADRLAAIERINAVIESRKERVKELNCRVAWDNPIPLPKRAAGERKKIIDEIRASASYRYGFLPLSKLGSVLR